MDSWETLHAFSDEMSKIAGIAPVLGGAALGGALGAIGGATTAGEGQKLRGALIGGASGAGVGALGGRWGSKMVQAQKGTIKRIAQARQKSYGKVLEGSKPEKKMGLIERMVGRNVAAKPNVEHHAARIERLEQMERGARTALPRKLVGLGLGSGVTAYGGGRVLGRMGQEAPQQPNPEQAHRRARFMQSFRRQDQGYQPSGG